MIGFHKGNITVRYGESLADAVNYIETTPRVWRVNASETNKANDSWDASAGMAGAKRLAAKGWEEGVAKMLSGLAALPANERTAVWRYDVAGEQPCIARYLSGDPLHMRRRKHMAGAAPVVHVAFNGWVLAMISAEEFINFGVALLSMIDRLESVGKRVHLDLLYVGRQNGREQCLGWNVKRAQDHVDLSALAFSIAHPPRSVDLASRLWSAVIPKRNVEPMGCRSR